VVKCRQSTRKHRAASTHTRAAAAQLPAQQQHTRTRLAAPVLPGPPEEQSLIASLRLHFADFPYLPCSTQLEAAHLGDLLRLSVRPAPTITIVPPDFQGRVPALRTRTQGPCSASQCSPSRTESIPGCTASASPFGGGCQQEKKSLPGASTRVSEFIHVAVSSRQPVPEY